MRSILVPLLLMASLAGAADAMKDPESIVLAFIQDYKSWNDRAYEESERLEHSEQAMIRAEAEYRKLLSKYCRPGFAGEPIAFGSESSHDISREKVDSVIIDGKNAIVKTRHTKKRGPVEMEDDYEYHLSLDGARWYLEQVYYVDADGKYEGL